MIALEALNYHQNFQALVSSCSITMNTVPQERLSPGSWPAICVRSGRWIDWACQDPARYNISVRFTGLLYKMFLIVLILISISWHLVGLTMWEPRGQPDTLSWSLIFILGLYFVVMSSIMKFVRRRSCHVQAKRSKTLITCQWSWPTSCFRGRIYY